ncbi:MAG: MBL fold metallo-hydrolase [Polyangiales bacterium]
MPMPTVHTLPTVHALPTVPMTAREPPKLVEVAAGVHAYLQSGSWGYSNAGLIADAGTSLLVDTLYDVPLTRQMLSTMQRHVPAAARIDTLVNTHANGDHCWGNQLLAGANIVSSRATAEEMLELKPALMTFLVESSTRIARLPAPARRLLGLLGRLGVPRVGPLVEAAAFVEQCFGTFQFRGVQLTVPTQTFEDKLSLRVGDKRVELLQVGPAHTKGDVLVWLPDERVVFTGDILFIQSHPIIWEGPISNWLAACDRILALDAQVIVPGHGPLTDAAGVRETKAYWQRILDAAQRGRAAGATPDEVARELLRSEPASWQGWGEAHRVVVNVDTAYRDLAGAHPPRDPIALFARMSRLQA